jgi:hypothetical protein
MAGGAHERTGVLVIRVWIEGEAEGGGLRARISHVADVLASERVERIVASREEIASVVEQWLDAFVAGDDA